MSIDIGLFKKTQASNKYSLNEIFVSIKTNVSSP